MAKDKKKKPQEDPNSRLVTRNRQAQRLYELEEEFECGIALKGSEVKSIRNNKISIEEAYARLQDGEIWLIGADVAEYPQANVMNHDPKRKRKLLLRKREITRCEEATAQEGMTLVPLSVYFHRGMVKVKIAIAKGRKLHDKREKLRQESDSKTMRSAKMNFQ